MTTQPSQLTPIYPFCLVGNATTVSGLGGSPWYAWKPQIEISPFAIQFSRIGAIWFDESLEAVSLAAYVRVAAGTTDDLDPELEAAAIEHLLQDDQAERQ